MISMFLVSHFGIYAFEEKQELTEISSRFLNL